jgi:uncharacterized protein YkwD
VNRRNRFIASLAAAGARAAPAAAAAAPRAVIDSGPADRTRETSATFSFRASESPPLGLGGPTTFECRLDGGEWGACTSPRAYSGLLGGTHTFEVRAAGLLDDRTPAVRTWVIEIVTEILPPAPGAGTVQRQPGPPRRLPRRRPRRRDAGGCAYAANRPGEVRPATLEGAVRCLIGRERARRGLPRMRPSRPLAIAAKLHVLDMWHNRYFAHLSRRGATPLTRIRRAGYFGPGQFGVVGEVLAWGDGRYATPRATVVGFMRSAAHRRVLLEPAFREIGVGVAPGAPARRRTGAMTVAAELGRRG